MSAIDIVILVVVILILIALIAYFVNKKVKEGRISSCDCCSSKAGLIKKYNKKYKKHIKL